MGVAEFASCFLNSLDLVPCPISDVEARGEPHTPLKIVSVFLKASPVQDKNTLDVSSWVGGKRYLDLTYYDSKAFGGHNLQWSRFPCVDRVAVHMEILFRVHEDDIADPK